MSTSTRAGLVLIALALVLATSALAAGAAIEYWYLAGDDEPVGSMTTATPTSASLPDYDGSDGVPGLLIQKGGSGSGESDPTRFQQWEYDVSGLTLSTNTLTIWAGEKDLSGAKTVKFTAYLMRCKTSCVQLAATTKTVKNSSDFVQVTFGLNSPQATYANGERLVVKIVVTPDSEDDMWFAYGTQGYGASLRVNVTATPPTTSTTTTPGATTSTSSSPTTTIPPTTTTTLGASSSTTQDSNNPGSSPTDPPNGDSDHPGQGPAVTTTPASPDARPQAAVPIVITPVVDASSEELDEDLFAAGTRLAPQEGLAVSFLSAAEALRSQFLASAGLGLFGAILVVFGMKSRASEDEDPESQ